jgi:hypothetical protein
MTIFNLIEGFFQLVGFVANICTILGIAFIIYQVKKTRDIQIAEMRPYVYLTLHKKLNKKKEYEVDLHLTNVGRTPAIDVVLSLENGKHYLLRDSGKQLPFLDKTEQKLNLMPGETRVYFVGRFANLEHLETEELEIAISYKSASDDLKFDGTLSYAIEPESFRRS